MNQMEQMGINPNTVIGLMRIIEIDCGDIPDGIGQNEDKCKETPCGLCIAERLLAEVPMKKVKRWELYDGDFAKAEQDFVNYCRPKIRTCKACRFKCKADGPSCFIQWLMEEVEVPEV